ncbi:phosphopantothenoylcysteine decarboxylase [endosymbiont of Acanthamoeba sp. UWC8]|uniref:flavoprotein n=1 Tax=endosymbiont of Acanthamoeba sp. UWC8 TaxID=86106 RepID=UPI0004D1ED08
MAKLLVIITGSIAAYKSIDLVRELEKKGHEISIILTESAKHFVSPLTYSSLTKAIIYNDYVFEDSHYNPMLHIELAKNHELVLVVPAIL